MGSTEVRNPLLSNKLKRTVTRLLIIDDNQIRFNQITDVLTAEEYQVQATLLDDLQNFEKQLNLNWDVIIFGRAYDLKYEQALSLLRNSSQADVPMILLKPDDYAPEQYLTYVRKGVYDILHLEQPEVFCLGLLRALAVSRLVQSQKKLTEELEIAQNQAQLLVEDSSKAIAIIQEGIHVQANEEYLKLFNLKSEDDLIGLPILDILQPLELPIFKTRLKKVSQGQFDLGALDITSQNNQITIANPLKIEFSPSTEEDAIQLTIDIDSTSSATTKTTTVSKDSAAALFQQINRSLSQQPSSLNTLVLFSLANCPESIFKGGWNVAKHYFEQIKVFLKDQTHVPLFRVSSGMYLGLFQAESAEKLESKLISLNALKKPQLLQIDQQSYPLHLSIGYQEIDGQLKDEKHLEDIIGSAFNHTLPSNKDDNALDLVPEFSFEPVQAAEPLGLDIPLTGASNESLIAPSKKPSLDVSSNDEPIIHALRQCLEKGEIHLKYQQLYDKEDSQLYTYEVTSGFIFDNKWQSITAIRELASDQELSIKLDRWILVEACKQLHNFITQYPEARLIVNLNKEVLLYDRTFPEFISKLITIIRSKLEHPLVLQFSEEDLGQHREDAKKCMIQLRKHGAEISLRDFGDSLYSQNFLEEFEIQSICISDSLAKKLNSDKTYPELQEKIDHFNELKPINILVRGLDDMTSFANAWNIEARFLQGDYFQKKLDHLIDIQDQ